MKTINITNLPVSIFDSVSELTGKCQTMHSFLNLGEIYQDKIENIRNTRREMERVYLQTGKSEEYETLKTHYQEQKKYLPCACLQGVMVRDKNIPLDDRFSDFTKILCIDIDNPKPHENGEHFDAEILRDELFNLPFVAYASLSVGGTGVFLLIPTDGNKHGGTMQEAHAEHWRAFARLLKQCYGITADGATKDITRLRTVSHDANAQFRTNAQIFTERDRLIKPVQHFMMPNYTFSGVLSDDNRRVEEYVQEIEKRAQDVTYNYENWTKLAAAFASMGEQGRGYFLRVSRFYDGYDAQEANRKFDSFLRGGLYQGKRCTIASFFHICKQHNIKPNR